MSAKPEAPAADAGGAPPKSKKMLIIVIALVVILLVAGGAAFFVMKQRAAAAADEEGADAAPAKAAAHAPAAPHTPPAYLPLDNMVVNLADPGGERVAQVGITFEVTDAKAVDMVKAYLPTIRSGVLLLISQRTAEELLLAEGKEKLAKDILREASIPFGGGDEDEEEVSSSKSKKPKKKKVQVQYPVVGVLFSSFIVQ